MLIAFRFRNSRSFYNETFISMQAVSYKEHPEHLIHISRRKLLKTLAVYGANSSGKSNLLQSLLNFHMYVYRQLSMLNAVPPAPFGLSYPTSPFSQIVPFWTPEGEEPEPTEMELSFLSSGRYYEYGFSICQGRILAEHLTADQHLVFRREENSIRMGRMFEKLSLSKASLPLRECCLFCTFLSSVDIPQIRNIMKPFESYFSQGILYYFEGAETLQVLEQAREFFFSRAARTDPRALRFAWAQLKKLGFPLADLREEAGLWQAGYRIRSRRTGTESVYYAPINDLSLNLLKHLMLFEQIYFLTQNGGTLVIDNLSSRFHPSITRFITDYFQQPGNETMQLIFTTHDVSLLNNRQFRRDEIAFVDMNDFCESRLYTLADIKVRSDASYSKDYLLGKYGAIPLIREEL